MINEDQLKEQLKDAQKAAKDMMDGYNKCVSKLNTPKLKKMKDAFSNIDFRNKESVMNVHKLMGEEMKKVFKNQK